MHPFRSFEREGVTQIFLIDCPRFFPPPSFSRHQSKRRPADVATTVSSNWRSPLPQQQKAVQLLRCLKTLTMNTISMLPTLTLGRNLFG